MSERAAEAVGTKRDIAALRSFSIPDLARARVAVLGDLMVDRFIWGRVARISPEAPVPIVEVDRHREHDGYRLGGAANVAHNIVSLGGRATLFGVLGDDDAGRQMWQMLASRGIDGRGIVTLAERPTTVKTRVIAHNQQVVRIDLEEKKPLHEDVLDEVYKSLFETLDSFDVIVVSDYAKGVVSAAYLSKLIQKARGMNSSPSPLSPSENSDSEAVHCGRPVSGVPVLIDPRVANFRAYMGATLLTPNRSEAYEGAGMRLEEGDAEDAAARWLSRLECEALLVTLGEEGMLLKKREGKAIRVASEAADVYDVTGAGDTVIAVMASAMAVGASMEDAMVLANMAAGIVVGRVGTATVKPADLTAALRRRA